LQRIVRDYINTHTKDRHDTTLGQYFPHGAGHSVGLNVSRPCGLREASGSGYDHHRRAGIHIPEEKIGVRIEDMLLIAPDGNQVLTKRLPSDPNEIERIMAGK